MRQAQTQTLLFRLPLVILNDCRNDECAILRNHVWVAVDKVSEFFTHIRKFREVVNCNYSH